ncbi:MAG TPA: hypothetical protein VI357_19320 [Mycobacteriales bacterium]
MIEKSLSTAVAGRHGTPEYRDLLGRVRRAGLDLTRALEERRTVSAVRRSYADLDDVLGRAVTYARRRVRGPHMPADLPVPPPLDNAAMQAWNADQWRLRNLREHLRFQALDDPRLSMPATVRVATRAATGPPMRALRVGEHRETVATGNGMGIDLATVLDRVSAKGTRTEVGSG